MKQYQIIRIRDGKLLGYVVGKTEIDGKPYLIYQAGVRQAMLRITETTERFYRVEVVEVAS